MTRIHTGKSVRSISHFIDCFVRRWKSVIHAWLSSGPGGNHVTARKSYALLQSALQWTGLYCIEIIYDLKQTVKELDGIYLLKIFKNICTTNATFHVDVWRSFEAEFVLLFTWNIGVRLANKSCFAKICYSKADNWSTTTENKTIKVKLNMRKSKTLALQ